MESNSKNDRPIVFPNLVNVGFNLADRIAPQVEKMRQASIDDSNRRFDTAVLVSGAFLFAGSIVAKFCEEFVKGFGSEMAKKLATNLPTKQKKPNETAHTLAQLNISIENMHLTCAGPRDLQQCIDRAVALVREGLCKEGVSEADARKLTSSLAETIGSQIKI